MKSKSSLGLVMLFVLVSSFSAIGQDRVFEAKIKPYESVKMSSIFYDYQVFELDARQVDSYLGEKRSFTDKFSFRLSDGRQWDFTLEPVEILTNETKVYMLTPEGRKEVTEVPAVKSFKGVFADGREGQLRLTVNGEYMYGMIRDGEEEYYIEPLQYFEHGARPGKFVFYNPTDITPEHNSVQCYRPDEPEDHLREDEHAGQRTGNCYKIKLSFFTDYLMYTDPAHPGLDANIDHVVAVLNNVAINYEYNGSINFDDGVTFEVKEVVISTCSTCDPVSSTTNPTSLLSEFSTWVDMGGFNQTPQSAHMWSNRDFVGTTVGLAFQSTNLYCNSKGRAILEDWTTTASLLKTMVSHEVGHNFNGVHDGTTGMILSPTVTATDTWSATSKSTISGQISAQSSCFVSCGAVSCSRVNDLTLSNVTNSDFSVSWTASPEHLYTVKVKELGSSVFLIDMTTSSNSVTLSPSGYAICKKYDVYVYNNCGGGSLSAPERILMIGPTTQGCASFSLAKSVGWNGTSIAFTDKSLNASSWLWNFGNGQTSTLQNPTVTYTSPGNYDVSLTVNNVHTMTRTAAVRILPDLNPPYTISQGGDFESNTNNFGSEVFEGTTNVWEFGSTSYVLATQGNAWKSYLNSDIPKVTSKSGLYSPRFNMTGYQNFQIHFDIGMETIYANGPIAVQLQYSLDNGTTWIRLGTAPDFYNLGPGCTPNPCFEVPTQLFSDKYGWIFNQNYLHKSIDINSLSGNSSVIFRFVASISSIFTDGYNIDGVLIDNFRIDAQNAIPLPLEVSSLAARPDGDNVLLTWKSYTADDIEFHNIYKSIDGINWIWIGKTRNNADKSPDYTFRDYFPVKGISYYKVGAIQYDGKEVFTNTVNVTYGAESEIVVYPNPVHTGSPLTITWPGTDFAARGVTVSDRTGRHIRVLHFDPATGLLDADIHAAGLYFIKLVSGSGKTHIIKLNVLE